MNDEAKKFVANAFTEIGKKLGSLSQKLGTGAAEIWRFTVIAQHARAKAELGKAITLIPLALVLFGWSVHVLRSPIPHDVKTILVERREPCNTPSSGMTSVFCFNSLEEGKPEDAGISNLGIALIASGIITFIAGAVTLKFATDGIFNAIRDSKMAEYDAYQDILNDLERFK